MSVQLSACYCVGNTCGNKECKCQCLCTCGNKKFYKNKESEKEYLCKECGKDKRILLLEVEE